MRVGAAALRISAAPADRRSDCRNPRHPPDSPESPRAGHHSDHDTKTLAPRPVLCEALILAVALVADAPTNVDDPLAHTNWRGGSICGYHARPGVGRLAIAAVLSGNDRLYTATAHPRLLISTGSAPVTAISLLLFSTGYWLCD